MINVGYNHKLTIITCFSLREPQGLGGCPDDLGTRLTLRRGCSLGRTQLRAQLAHVGPCVCGAPFHCAAMLQLHPRVASVAHREREVTN